jgi:hypothetical protein
LSCKKAKRKRNLRKPRTIEGGKETHYLRKMLPYG